VYLIQTLLANSDLDKEHKECIIYTMLETILLLILYLGTCYSIPVLLLILMNGEQPKEREAQAPENSREAVAIDPELRSSKRHA